MDNKTLLQLTCPSCQEKLAKSHGDEVKLRVKMVKWNSKGMFAVCKSCGQDVPVGMDFMKSIEMKFTLVSR